MGRRLVGRARRRRLEGLLEEAAAAKGLGHNARAHTLLQEVAGHAGAGPFARVAAYELALILSQLGRHEEADAWLGRISFSYKLSPCILDASSLSGPTSRGATDVVAAFDGVLPPDLLRGLQAAFAPDSPFWPEHGYPTPAFFSYNEPLGGPAAGAPLIRDAAECLQRLAAPAFPGLLGSGRAPRRRVASVEWWAHLRPPGNGSGHQLHYDLDEAGLAALPAGAPPPHPLVSCVLYLSGGEDGAASAASSATLVTDQGLKAGHRAQRAWLCTPRANRALLFDGGLLHGVVPRLVGGAGTGPSPAGGPRVTLMLGLWGEEPGPTCSPAPAGGGGSAALLLGPNMRLPPPGSGKSWPRALGRPEGGAACASEDGVPPSKRPRLGAAAGSPAAAPATPPAAVPVDLAGPVSPVWCALGAAGGKQVQPADGSEGVEFIGRWFLDHAPEQLQQAAAAPAEGGGGGLEVAADGGGSEVEEVSMEELQRLRAASDSASAPRRRAGRRAKAKA